MTCACVGKVLPPSVAQLHCSASRIAWNAASGHLVTLANHRQLRHFVGHLCCSAHADALLVTSDASLVKLAMAGGHGRQSDAAPNLVCNTMPTSKGSVNVSRKLKACKSQIMPSKIDPMSASPCSRCLAYACRTHVEIRHQGRNCCTTLVWHRQRRSQCTPLKHANTTTLLTQCAAAENMPCR